MDEVISVRVNDRAVELFYGKTCNCDMTVEEVSRTLDEILDNERVPKCPSCEAQFDLVSVVVLLDKEKLMETLNTP